MRPRARVGLYLRVRARHEQAHVPGFCLTGACPDNGRYQAAGVGATRRVALTPAGLLPFPVAGGAEPVQFVAVGISPAFGALGAGAQIGA